MSRLKGRSDVFARRWEKWDGSIAGYAPVYADSSKEAYLPYSSAWAEKHLLGNIVLGIYPLLSDNTSHFIAADFDGSGWKESTKAFIATCRKYGLSIVMERSRSGNGAHAWCFFAEAYPAYKSRRIFLELLRESGVIGQFDKNESFDRLFPNQDYHSGKGLGNLIALPLQGIPRKQGNSIFVDADQNFQAYENQWQYLKDVQLLTPQKLDEIYSTFSHVEEISKPDEKHKQGEISLVVSNTTSIQKQDLFPKLISYLREELNLLNIEYVVKERAGLPTFGSPKYLNTIQSENGSISFPRGFLPQLCAWLVENNIKYSIKNRLVIKEPFEFTFGTKLFPYQSKAVATFENTDNGILVAPAGSGKTVMGLALVAQKKQPAIILTHRRQIYDQWLERIEHSIGIPKTRIGQICSTKKEAMLPLTVAMVQTLSRIKDWGGIEEKFGTVVVDECHHMPAQMFRDVVSKFKGRFLFGLTATPERKFNDAKLISAYLGPTVHTIEQEEIEGNTTDDEKERDTVIVRMTETEIPFATTPRNFPLVSKVLSSDARRNALIATDIANEAKSGKKCLVLTERKEHAEMLRAYLRKDFETILFSGDLSARQRKLATQKIKSGRFQILIATGQILGEGTDIANLAILFLTFPVSFQGKLAQYIGRIRREGGTKKIYDYRDAKVMTLEKMWKKRATHYRKSGFAMTDSRPDNSLIQKNNT